MSVLDRTHPIRLLALAAPWTTPLDPSALLGTFGMARRRTGAAHPTPGETAAGTPRPTPTPTIRWGSRAVVEASRDDLILNALEGAGLEPTFGCRRGVCRRCVVRLEEGRVRDRRDERDVDAGTHVRICVSSALTDVHLEPGTATSASAARPTNSGATS